MKTLLPLIRKLGALIGFFGFYLHEMLISSLRVACDVLTPGHQMHPAFLHLPVDDLNDRQRFILTNLISMTPGTLSIDLLNDDRILLIHNMYSANPEAEVKELERAFKRRIKNVF